MKRLGSACVNFFTGYFNMLLLSLLLLFAFRPYHRGGMYMGIWQLLFIAVFFSLIFNCKHPKYITITSIIVGIPALVLNWWTIYHRTELTITIYLCLALAFVLICASSIISRVVINARVTLSIR